jgi:hypothetical protein
VDIIPKPNTWLHTLSYILAGNLKHKDLLGQVVSSQAYLDDQNETVPQPAETIIEDEPMNSAE